MLLHSQKPVISLLTCGSGDELQNTFGHSAIRVQHLPTDYDVVYGYGTYNFNQPNFYLNFCRGKLLYYVNVTQYDRFIAEYNYFKRDVFEQILDLDSIQTYKAIAFLENNIKKENRYYKYDFFWDNCSTRIRDIFSSKYSVEWPSSKVKCKVGERSCKTYRDLLDEKLVPLVWSDFGIDLVIGAVADDFADYKNQMFLPSYLMDIFDQTKIEGRPLVKNKRTILEFRDAHSERWEVPFITPTKIIFGILFLISLWFLINNKMSNRLLNISGFLWFLLMSIISLIIVFLWFFTDHLATKENWNLIWISPLYLFALLKYKSIRKKPQLRWVPMVLIGLNVFALMAWNFIPQRWHIAFLPMMVISIIFGLNLLRSSFSHSRMRKRKEIVGR